MTIPVLHPHLDWSDVYSFLTLSDSPKCKFEKKLNDQFGYEYSTTFSSGRACIFNILKANKIKNKFVLVTAYTCCVVTEAIVQSGNTPIFVDVEKI